MKTKTKILAIGLLLLSGLVAIISSCSKDDAEPAELSSLTVKTAPLKTDYKVGETLDLSGLVVTLKMDDGTAIDMNISDFTAEGITCTPANESIISISTSSVKITHTASSKNVSQSISVEELIITGIEIKAAPTKIDYYEEDSLKLDGLIVTLTKEDSSTEDVDFSGFGRKGIVCNPEQDSELTININNIEITHSNSGTKVNQLITVTPIEIIDISIKTAPVKTDYYVNELLDLSGIAISFHMNNGSTRDVIYNDFVSEGITCNPENETVLTTTTNVVITHSESSYETTQNMEVGVMSDCDGNTYDIVKIGDQVWMAHNLMTTKFNDGTEIALVTDATEWAGLESPAYCWYDNQSYNYKEDYGAMYNWFTVNTEKLCPFGWHVPSYTEWQALLQPLGNLGGKLKEAGTAHWLSPNTGATNSTGFNALPGGDRFYTGSFERLSVLA